MWKVYKNCSNVTNCTVLKEKWLLQKRHPHRINKRALKTLLNQQLSNKWGCNVWLMNFVMNINKHCSLLSKLTPGSRNISISWWSLYFYFTFLLCCLSHLWQCIFILKISLHSNRIISGSFISISFRLILSPTLPPHLFVSLSDLQTDVWTSNTLSSIF